MLIYPNNRGELAQWQTKSIAIMNRVLLVAINKAAGGGSEIVAPDGSSIVRIGKVETIITARVDLDEVRKMRKLYMTSWLNRRPETYKTLVEKRSIYPFNPTKSPG